MKKTFEDSELEKFVRQALEIQLKDSATGLSESELKAIALRAGLTEADWDRLCQELNAHLDRGKNFLECGNAQDAVRELELAVLLAPYRADILLKCAQANHLFLKNSKSTERTDRAIQLYEKCLQIEPANLDAASGLSELKHQRDQRSAKFSKKFKVLVCGAFASLLMIGSGIFVWNNVPEQDPAASISLIESIPDDAAVLGDRAFKIFRVDVPWDEAKRMCEKMGGHLAIANDRETVEFLHQLKGGQRLWLGATDEKTEGDWRWIDGSEVTVDNWADRQPFNLGNIEHYMELGPGGGFNDVAIEGPTKKWRINGFICEWPAKQKQSSKKSLRVDS